MYKSQIDNFMKEILDVCKKHGLSISHEDGHGNFIIEEYSDNYSEWFKNAEINVKIDNICPVCGKEVHFSFGRLIDGDTMYHINYYYTNK